MIKIYPDTGIQLIPLNYTIDIGTLRGNVDEYIIDLISGIWTPIILDASARDYGRIFCACLTGFRRN